MVFPVKVLDVKARKMASLIKKLIKKVASLQ